MRGAVTGGAVRSRTALRATAGLLAALGGVMASVTCGAASAAAQVAVGREAARALDVPPLHFEPPEPELREVAGVPVLFLEDRTLPLVDVLARFRGGYARFDRSLYAAGTALPTLLRYGGTRSLPPDSVDALLEYYALATSFGGAGESVSASVNALSEHLEVALDLWGDLLRSPGFDPREVEVWRGRELESVRRRLDDPTRLAFSEFNRLLYGSHPVGWEMEPADLEPERLTPAILRDLHARIACRDHLILGVTGDVSWKRVEPLIERLLGGWPSCADTLPAPKVPEIRREAGVFLIPRDLEQSVVVMAHPTAVHLEDAPEYFAAQIGNALLGGSGFSSRILSRVRTEEGYAYSASSLWTTPRDFDGIVGVVTRTKPETTVPAVRTILEILADATEEPPSPGEVDTAVDQIANGFIFNFETATQVVRRRMFYRAEKLPGDWLERYLRGVQRVTPGSVQRAFYLHLRPAEMTILVVGDPERIGREALATLGPVTVLEVEQAR